MSFVSIMIRTVDVLLIILCLGQVEVPTIICVVVGVSMYFYCFCFI